MAEENKILYRITVDAKTATGTISNMYRDFGVIDNEISFKFKYYCCFLLKRVC